MPPSDIFRPQFHFTSPRMWMNDPNGLVYYRGEYHLFYQYHPSDVVWGPMHWGHAVSHDLINWEHLPIALHPDEQCMIFSGSAVVDWRNTAGFGREALVAIYTCDKDEHETQNIAYSTDLGRTWTKYPGNPVIPAPDPLGDFRDPKVFWNEDHWVMSLAAGNRILFYASTDLKNWEQTGMFGNGAGSTEGVWETPDLFQLPVDAGDGSRWVLTVAVNKGAPAGGSGTQYFIGDFVSGKFESENTKDTILWMDRGADFYAPQSWNEEPLGRQLMIGWMNNWQYANLTPTTGWRGSFSIVRELSLKRTGDGIRLIQQPVTEIQSLRTRRHHWQKEIIQPGNKLLDDINGKCLEIIAEFQVQDNVECFGFHIRAGQNENTVIGYRPDDRILFVDRTNSGEVDFHAGFAGLHPTHLSPIDGVIFLHIIVDSSSVEVFANDGLVVLTDCIFPSKNSQGVELFAEGGNIILNECEIYELTPAKFKIEP